MNRNWIASVAIATTVSLVSLGTVAADERAPSRIVKAWDLDLGDSNGLRTLYDRLRAAAADLCETEALQHWQQTRMPAPLGWRDRCVNDAMDTAVRDAGNSRLAALHARMPVVAARR